MIAQLEQEQDDAYMGDIRCLTFRLGDENCAIRIDNVREVLEIDGVTNIPRTPDHLCGVFNLRGAVVPVIDVRHLFNPNHVVKEHIKDTVIVFDIHDPGGTIVVGLLADEVYEVIEIPPHDLEVNTHESHGKFIKFIIKRNDSFTLVLDIHALLTAIDENLLTNNPSE